LFCGQPHITPGAFLQQAVQGQDEKHRLKALGLKNIKFTPELRRALKRVAGSPVSPSDSRGPSPSAEPDLPSCAAESAASAAAEPAQHQLDHEVALQHAMLLLEELSDKNIELEMALQGSER